MFHISMGYISHVRLRRSPKKTCRKMNLLFVTLNINQFLHCQQSYLVTVQRFPPVAGATHDVHRPVGSCSAPVKLNSVQSQFRSREKALAPLVNLLLLRKCCSVLIKLPTLQHPRRSLEALRCTLVLVTTKLRL